MATRGFLANQLLQAEEELSRAATEAQNLAFDLGEHSDEIHWDKAAALPADKFMEQVNTIRMRVARAEGLLFAYNIHLKAQRGE